MKSANHVLAENLRQLIAKQGTNNLQLGKLAGVAPNTIKNYTDFDPNDPRVTSTGKERSAKLTEVEKLASALGVSLLDLLREHGKNEQIQPTLGPDDVNLLADFEMLESGQRSKFRDAIHQAAEHNREVIAQHERKQRKAAAPTKAPATTADERRGGGGRASMSLTYGDGNERQSALPLSTVRDPFTATPGERESAMYEQFELHPKP